MRVTDEMVNKALDTLIEYGVLSMDTSIESDTAAARAALEAALSHASGQEVDEQRDMSILDKYAEVASALGFEGDAWFGDPLAGHEEIVHRAQNYADEAWTAKLRRGMDEYAEALADERAAGQKGKQCRAASVTRVSTHHVHRGPDSLPCYCLASSDHQIGNEVEAGPDEVALSIARQFVPADEPQKLAQLQCAIIRALSRGVPEGE